MKSATRATLQEAYRLITTGECDSARALIKPVLAAEKDNIDAWWLAVHAAVTPHDRRLALVQVLRLNPRHRPAHVMLDRLNAANPDEVDELADDLPLPPPGQQARDLVRPHQRRWVWNVMIGLGCLSFTFASTALISGIMGMNWFEKTVEHIAGIEKEQGAGGQLGTVQGGDPQHPYEIPITEKKAVDPSGEPIVSEINPDEAHVYTFQAEYGDEVIALLQFTIAGDAHYTMELWDANYKKLANGVASDNGATINLVYEVRKTGQYALILIGRPNGPRGGYALGLDVLKP
jgi:hypothetical protein